MERCRPVKQWARQLGLLWLLFAATSSHAGEKLVLIASADSRTYVADLGLRYPLNDDWRINPRLKLGYRNDDLAGFERFSVTPSIGMTYLLSDHWRFEAEAAVRFEHEFGGEDADDTADVMVRTGYLYQF